MCHIQWWLLPLAIGIVAGQESDELSSLEFDGEPLFDIDFSESANAEEGTADEPLPQSFDNLDDTANSKTKSAKYNTDMKEREEQRRQKKDEEERETHRKREAAEAQLASTNEKNYGRMGGRGPGGPRGRPMGGRLGFGAPVSNTDSATPKSIAKSNFKSERPTPKQVPTANPVNQPAALQDRSVGGNDAITDKDIVNMLAKNLGITTRPSNSQSPQRCFECKNAPDAAECLNSGHVKSCNSGEACQTEVRWENGNVKLESTCKQKNACMVMIRQNENCNRLKGQEGVNRTCWRCCTGDLCNLANINPDRI